MEEHSKSQQSLKILRNQIEPFSFDSAVQLSNIPKDLWWNAASDLATEWNWNYIKELSLILLENNIIDDAFYELLVKMNKNFSDASLNGTKYTNDVWTLEGFKNHPFWTTQRKIAREIILKLDTIN